MLVDITNIILTELDNELDVPVLSAYQSVVPEFPTVIFEEVSNSDDIDTKDSSGVIYNNVSFRVEIYTKGSGRVYRAKQLRNKIDKILKDKFGMNRSSSNTIPNYIDENIYRYRMMYDCKIDKNRTIYRR